MIPCVRSCLSSVHAWTGWLLVVLLLALPAQAAPPRVELLPGAKESDWLLIVEADGERRDDELDLRPLLRQFAVGRVSISRVHTQTRRLTRWQIPLHLLATSPRLVPPLSLGTEFTPQRPLTAPRAAGTLVPLPAQLVSPVELQAQVLHQGPLYPGQPFIYQLSLWLPANLEAPHLGEPAAPAFTIRRLGDDRWESPASPGMPGRLTRKWLLQAREPGQHAIESPRLEGRLPDAAAPTGTEERLSARATTLFVKVDKAPLEPVASSLVLRQQLSPLRARVGEPVIRTLTLVMQGGDGSRLSPLPAPPLPTGLSMQPDGEQQQERFVAEGVLRFERQWRQALIAGAAGSYALPAQTLRWFNTQSGRIEEAQLPAQTLVFEAGAGEAAAPPPGTQSLYWVMMAILLRAWWRRWPRWLAFYRLQRALAARAPDAARRALLAWAALRWGTPCLHLASLPCHRDPVMGPLLDGLDRACFGPPQAVGDTLHWQALARELCTRETFAIAYALGKLAWRRS
ncbi:BatD family protein [Aeromonas sanarellii]|uniref:BatD family protein n=1 Tax=Aeromonas sanarellii TaxID=633415 RepID=A0ABS4B1S3_9GAMM|nr:BatD family protein [Aeromonas sanarellii]